MTKTPTARTEAQILRSIRARAVDLSIYGEDAAVSAEIESLYAELRTASAQAVGGNQ